MARFGHTAGRDERFRFLGSAFRPGGSVRASFLEQGKSFVVPLLRIPDRSQTQDDVQVVRRLLPERDEFSFRVRIAALPGREPRVPGLGIVIVGERAQPPIDNAAGFGEISGTRERCD